MHKRVALFFSLIAGFAFTFASTHARAQGREQGRLLQASDVLQELRDARDQLIPSRLLERAYGIAVVPDVTKVAFFAGGRHGNGVLVARDKDGRFSNPIFVSVTGGSFGWQWGVQSTDFVLVFTSRAGIEGITGGKLTLGADASVAAGPVGRQASAGTDTNFNAEVYSYSRNRGLFVGVALDGSAITIDNKANSAFYRKPGVLASDILGGAVKTDDSTALKFLGVVAEATGTRAAGSASESHSADATPSGPALPPPNPTPGPPPAPSGAAKSFPMEDAKPGQEPSH